MWMKNKDSSSNTQVFQPTDSHKFHRKGSFTSQSNEIGSLHERILEHVATRSEEPLHSAQTLLEASLKGTDDHMDSTGADLQ